MNKKLKSFLITFTVAILWASRGLIAGGIEILITNVQGEIAGTNGAVIRFVNEIDEASPYNIDDETVMEGALLLPDNKIKLDLTILIPLEDEVTIEIVKQLMDESLLTNFNNTPELKEICEKDSTSLIYSYKDKDGVALFDIEISPDDYDIE